MSPYCLKIYITINYEKVQLIYVVEGTTTLYLRTNIFGWYIEFRSFVIVVIVDMYVQSEVSQSTSVGKSVGSTWLDYIGEYTDKHGRDN